MAKKAPKAQKPKYGIKHYMNKKFAKKVLVRIVMYLVLFDLAFVFLHPFITMIVDAFKSDADLVNITVKWIPSKLEWNNFKVAFEKLNYMKYLKNSLVVTGVATIGHTLVCSFIGYGFARYNFKGRGILFAGVVLSMIVPVQVLIFPEYIVYAKLGWEKSYLPILVPTFFGFGLRGGFYIFLFRQFFLGLPYEMEEAARIDGCGPLKTFFKIMLPMARSSMLVCVVLSIVWHWNDYFEPSIYLNEVGSPQLLPSKLPDMYAQLAALSAEASDAATAASGVVVNEAICMASTFLVILPLLIAYMFVQKQFMEGVERSGLTGM